MLKITILRLSMLHICDSIQCIFVSFTIEVKHTRVSHAPSLSASRLRYSAFHFIFLLLIECYILYNCYNCSILIILISLCLLDNKGLITQVLELPPHTKTRVTGKPIHKQRLNSYIFTIICDEASQIPEPVFLAIANQMY
uniref:P-loop containing nucleoside triphosphate hydrolase protein n=1 Tax=Heterorhabditis bacteriophora TaxID=37862 RepID=A0A1I7WED1_HETBA